MDATCGRLWSVVRGCFSAELPARRQSAPPSKLVIAPPVEINAQSELIPAQMCVGNWQLIITSESRR
jgi:hypothetical protein